MIDHASQRSYDEDLNKGVMLSGEPPDYFARKRVEFVARSASLKSIDIKKIVEFGCGTGNNIPYLRQLSLRAK